LPVAQQHRCSGRTRGLSEIGRGEDDRCKYRRRQGKPDGAGTARISTDPAEEQNVPDRWTSIRREEKADMYRFVLGLVFCLGGCAVPEVEADELARGRCLQVGDEVVCPGDLPAEDLRVSASISERMRATCRQLLDRSGVDRISTCPIGPSDVGDFRLPGKARCLRDSYVFTALAYCWRSECLQNKGVTEADYQAGRSRLSPDWEAQAASNMLEAAGRLCRVSTSETACTSSDIVSCP
jgi:hypothetical protein